MQILIGLLEHLGDVVACEPVVRHIRREYPGATLVWAIMPNYRELIDSNPLIDETIVLDCLTDWIKMINHVRYDRIVDLHVNYRVCSHCRIPLYKTNGNPFVSVHEWFDYGSILEAFSVGAGLPKLSEQPSVYIQQKHKDVVASLNLGTSYCVIHRSSNSVTKDWRDDYWQKICDWLISKCHMDVIEVGVGPEHLAPLCSLNGWRSLYNKTSILETAEVIRNASLFIGVDSGPAHLANAVQTPGVVLLGIMGYFRQYNPFSGYYGEKSNGIKVVRNLTGPVSEIPLGDVTDAISYMVSTSKCSASDAKSPRIISCQPLETGAGCTIKTAPIILEPRPLQPPNDYPQVFCFYLPQFHPINENDYAHGAGFTEWSNVISSKPLFRGHYQPRQPGEFGYYDLRAPEVIEAQIDVAISHGISGFCFYYYYFKGKKLLYRPIENFLKSKQQFPFFFLWANENWTKRWDGGDHEIIIGQSHSDEDDVAFIQGLLPIFEDDRYVKVHGKPLLLIYKTHLFDDIKRSTERWRTIVEKAGYNGLYLVMVDDWFSIHHPREYGFDASYEIPSNITLDEFKVDNLGQYETNEEFSGKLIDYQKFSQYHLGRTFPEYKRFRTVMAPWDNSPRYKNKAIIHVNISNDAYKKWLLTAYIETYNRYSLGERIVFVHSWNEWCEGTYIEPDGRYGRNLLEQTSAAIREGQDAIRLSRELDVSPGSLMSLVRIYREKEEAAFRVTKMLRDKANHSAHEANQNGSCFSCQVYWRGSDEDYTESRSQSSLLGIGIEQQRIGFALPGKAVQSLRFDPSNRKGLLRLYAVRLLGAGICLWEWDGKIETLAPGKLNSILLSPIKGRRGGAVLCLLSDDPWLELPVPPEVLSQADYLEADISWPMPEDLLGVQEKWEDLMGQNKHFAMELEAVLHSRSWNFTKPLRWAVRQLRRFRAKCG